MKNFNDREFRQALGSFGTGVTIVTTRDSRGDPVGMTASSFNSVSIEPPLVLWSVTKTAGSAEAFRNAEYFAVHVLAAEQMDLSNQFSRAGEDKFAGIKWHIDHNKTPVIDDVSTRFDCRTWEIYEGGDHWIIVGEVCHLHTSNRPGLLFAGGSYAMSTPIKPKDPSVLESASENSPIDSMLVYNLARAYRQLTREFHQEVLASGLRIPAWRILASLHGGVSRRVPDLSARTFLDREALEDELVSMQEQGLVSLHLEDEELITTATKEGHKCVEHLFDMARNRDTEVLGDNNNDELMTLIKLLRKVIDNTTL